jgi:hypothetical protein
MFEFNLTLITRKNSATHFNQCIIRKIVSAAVATRNKPEIFFNRSTVSDCKKLPIIWGPASMAGSVPRKNASMVTKPEKADAPMAAPIYAAEVVMQGNKNVTNPNIKDRSAMGSPNIGLNHRITNAGITSSRCIHCSENIIAIPWIPKASTKTMLMAKPTGFQFSLISDWMYPKVEPANKYPKRRPALYNHNGRRATEACLSKVEQTSGAHMPTQCQDIRKLNDPMAKNPAAVSASTPWRACCI